MRSDKPAVGTSNTRQKVTIIAFVIVLIIVFWQLIGLFRGSSTRTPPPPVATTELKPGQTPPTYQGVQAMPQTPQPAPLPKLQPATPVEAQLLLLQQETEAKYIAALNELQMLKIARQIAETNQAIAAAKLATVTAEKNIITLLTPPAPVITPPSTYNRNFVNPVALTPVSTKPTTPQPATTTTTEEFINYTVVSVTQLQNQWRAVMGYGTNLFQVQVNDILPPDQSRVVSINKSGVILETHGVRRRVSLVPII